MVSKQDRGIFQDLKKKLLTWDRSESFTALLQALDERASHDLLLSGNSDNNRSIKRFSATISQRPQQITRQWLFNEHRKAFNDEIPWLREVLGRKADPIETEEEDLRSGRTMGR